MDLKKQLSLNQTERTRSTFEMEEYTHLKHIIDLTSNKLNGLLFSHSTQHLN